MEPLTTALISALSAASGTMLEAITGGALEAAGGDTWTGIQNRLTKLTRLQTRARSAAFGAAVEAALVRFRQTYADQQAGEQVLALLTDTSLEGRAFSQMAIEELLLSARPNLGRLLDHYRRDLRFVALLQGKTPPPWSAIEPALRIFLGTLLPEAMAEQRTLRPLLLEQSQLQVLDVARTTAYATTSSAATLLRIEQLLTNLADGPHHIQRIVADAGGVITHVQQVVAQHYHAAPELPKPDLDALFERYRTFLIETYSTLDFRGILQMQNVVRLRLEEVYVPLKGPPPTAKGLVSRIRDGAHSLAKQLAEEGRSRQEGVLWREADAARNTVTSLHDLIRDTPFLVVLGDPGAGKSTLVRYVMLALAEGQAQAKLGLDDEWLPILFPVAAFAEARGDPGQRDLDPVTYMSTYYRGLTQPDYGPLFLRALLAGRALVLLDGLDEVREDRLALVRCLEAFVREWDGPGNRFVATSRIAGYDDASLDDDLFMRTTVQPFDDDDIQLFTQQWSRAYERTGMQTQQELRDPAVIESELQRRATARAESLSSAVFGTSGVTDLARNPLLLTILALIHQQGTRLPDRRVELYRLCVEALAETWNRARSLSGREIDIYLGGEKLDERFVVNLLGPAALWIHTENPGGLVDQRELEQQLTHTLVQTDGLPYGKAQRLASNFVDLVRRHTGLLQERGHRLYGFLHLTFEEYLAARALLESVTVDDPDALIHDRSTDTGWREVLRLAIAAAPQREAQRLLLHMLDAPAPAEHHGRPVVLAGECLRDIGRSGATQRAWSAVVDRLVQLVGDTSAPILIRVEGGQVLGQLGDPRLLEPRTGKAIGYGNAGVPSYWCHVDKGTFWYGDESENEPLQQVELPYDFKIARYPVTNAEYALFIEDGGYDPVQPWWTEHGRGFILPGGHQYDGDQEQPITLPRYWDDSQINSPSQPVVGISWYEAAAYCAWLNMRGHIQGWLPHESELRLSTSLEWERAARHTDQRRYPWGTDDLSPEYANYNESKIDAPSPVGCFPLGTAVCGALDMMGNVSEWLTTPYKQSMQNEIQKDFTSSEGVLLIWSDYSDRGERLHCGSRNWSLPFSRINNLGFRIVWSVAAHI